MGTKRAFGCCGFGVVVFVLVMATISWVSYQGIRLMVMQARDPQRFEDTISEFLGISHPDYETDASTEIESFRIKYWDGRMVEFWVPQEVWVASVQKGAKQGCDPLLLVSVAFSESTSYNNSVPSPVGAKGVWQFMPETWKMLWSPPRPPRTHIPSAADGACRYLKMTGAAGASKSTKEAFIYKFAVEPPVWNQHPAQAEFVYRLYKELRMRDTGSKFALAGIQPLEIDLVQQLFIWYLDDILGIFPKELLQVAEGAGAVLGPIVIPDVTNPGQFSMPYDSYKVTQGPHGQSYGHLAVDISCGKGCVIKAPISGVVVRMGKDGYGNTVIVIENKRYKATMLHGKFFVPRGNRVSIGSAVGTESNIGNTWSGDRYCGEDSDCGYHTHLNVYDKKLKRNVYPLSILQSYVPGMFAYVKTRGERFILNPMEGAGLSSLFYLAVLIYIFLSLARRD